MRTKFFPIVLLALGVLTACSPEAARERSFKKYLRQNGYKASSVIFGERPDSVGRFICAAQVSDLLAGYTVNTAWDVVFNGGKVTSATLQPLSDATPIFSTESGEQRTLGDYIQKDYFPHLVDPEFQGIPLIDSMMRDQAVFLRHRQAYLAGIPVGDRALYQVVGPVKTMESSSLYWYYDKFTGFESRDDGFDFLLSRQEFDEQGMAGDRSGFIETVSGDRTTYTRNVKEQMPQYAVTYYRSRDVLTYKSGRLVGIDYGIWSLSLSYGENNLIRKNSCMMYYYDGKKPFSRSVAYNWGEPSHESYSFTYDAAGNCVTMKNYEYGSDGTSLGGTVTRYTILKTDRLGNWTERSRNDGTVETRTITYYLP